VGKNRYLQDEMSTISMYRWTQDRGASYRKSDPVKGWTCWAHNPQVESNSDTPQMPLKVKTQNHTGFIPEKA